MNSPLAVNFERRDIHGLNGQAIIEVGTVLAPGDSNTKLSLLPLDFSLQSLHGGIFAQKDGDNAIQGSR